MVEGKTNKTLIISPHPDDEVYGCSSYLKDAGEDTIVIYVTTYHPLFPAGENVEEQQEVAAKAQFSSVYLSQYANQTNSLDCVGQVILVDELQEQINKWQPTLVLIPSPSYNQDHRAVYDAALTAMRPHDRNHFVNCVLLFEEPDTFGTLRKPDPFRPNYYRELDLDFKLELMAIYKSQMRGHRTPEDIGAIARVRGMQVNMEYAEAFEVLRWAD